MVNTIDSRVRTSVWADGLGQSSSSRRVSASRRPSPSSSEIKRAIDIFVAAAALLFLLPLLLLLGALIRFESQGPALFRQRRTGLNGSVFTIYKLRSMRVQEDGPAIRHATKDDLRVTRVGAFLRKSSLDELPQLINVLKGDMSIVGPRPHALSHDEHYGGLIEAYNGRFRAKPGLTGLAQVVGLRGEVHTIEHMMRRVDADNAYIDSWSLKMDLSILLKTIPLIVSDPRAY